jgi:hypothetical protein
MIFRQNLKPQCNLRELRVHCLFLKKYGRVTLISKLKSTVKLSSSQKKAKNRTYQTRFPLVVEIETEMILLAGPSENEHIFP